MANNTTLNTMTGGDVVSDDQLTTLNGGAIVTGEKVQRVKLAVGAPGTATDVTTTAPLPVTGGSATTGSASVVTTFTAADIAVAVPDGTGTLISGTSTAGSTTAAFAVADGMIGSLFLIKGLTASQTAITIYFEGSANSTNGTDGDWIELKQRRTGTQVGIESGDYKTQANGYFRGNCANFKWLRARLLGTFTGTPSAQMWTSAGQGATFFNSGLPGGNSAIGRVAIDQTTNIIAGTTMQNAAVAVGNGVNLNVQGYTTAIISITGTMSAGTLITFNQSPDDVQFRPITAHQLGVNGNMSTTTTVVGEYRISCAGLKSLQAVITTYGAGTVTVKGTVSVLSGHSTTMNANIIAALPTGANTIGGVLLTDGTNVANILKADGTAAGQNSQLVSQTDLVSNGTITTQNLNLNTGVPTAGSFVGLTLSGSSIVGIQLSGTYTGVIVPQVSNDGGANWVTINQAGIFYKKSNGTSLNTLTAESGFFQVAIAGAGLFRLTMSNAPSGSAVINMRSTNAANLVTVGSPLPASTFQIGNVGQGGTWNVNTTDGTNVANILKADGTVAGNNSQLVAPAVQTINFTTSTVGASTILANTDVSHYSSIEIVYTSVGVGLALTGQFSPTTGGAYLSQGSFSSSTLSSNTNALGVAVGTIYTSPVRGNFFQIAISALTSGTFTGTVTLRTVSPVYNATTLINGSVSSNSATGSAVPSTAHYMALNAGGNLSGLQAQSADNAGSSTQLAAGQSTYNGTTWDRARGNESVTLLASAARTVTTTSADLINYNGASLIDVILDMTVVGTGSVTVTINGKDPASGKYYLLLSGAAIVANSTNVYTLNPSLATAVVNVSAQKAIPRIFQIVVTANNVNTATYSVGYNLMRG